MRYMLSVDNAALSGDNVCLSGDKPFFDLEL